MRAVTHQVFRTFGFDPWDFHFLLHSTGSVVAGPAALTALFPRQIRTKTMDIYVTESEAGELVYFLQEVADYVPMLGPFYHTSDFQWNGLSGYLPLASSSKQKMINVYIASSSPLAPLIKTKSTMAMNLITGQYISSTKPSLYLYCLPIFQLVVSYAFIPSLPLPGRAFLIHHQQG